tara:strand:- start:603 stop:878 length:276 start_codon:yes stop_codon:yes gene_type:complete
VGIVGKELLLVLLNGAVPARSVRGKEMIIIKVIYENKKPDLIFVSEASGDTAKETVGEVLRSDYLKSDEVMRLIDEDVHSIEIRNTEKKKK